MTTLCPSTPSLRAALDERDAAIDAHVDGCAICRGALDDLAATAGVAAAAVRQLEAGPEVGAADADRLLAAVTVPDGASTATVTPLGPRRRSARTPRFAVAAGVVVLAVAVAVTPFGRGAVAQVLDLFRGERLQVVAFDASAYDTAAQDLGPLGHVSGEPAEPQPVADLAAAEALAGIHAPVVDTALLPAGVQPAGIFAAPPSQVSVTFDRTLAPELPDGLDGVTLRVDLPGVIGQVFTDPDAVTPEAIMNASGGTIEAVQAPGAPDPGPAGDDDSTDGGRFDSMPPHTALGTALGIGGVVVGAAGQLAISAEGAPLEDVRAALLSSGLLPPDLAAQLSSIPDWRTTLPLPVPVGSVAWRDADVVGNAGYVFGDASGLVAAVVWQTGTRSWASAER